MPQELSVKRYYAKVIEKIEIRPGCWAYNKIGIFERLSPDNTNDKQIGSYQRNYDAFFDTFHPFQIKDKKDPEGNPKWYALYSRSYTATRLMSLPDCTDLGGEDPAGHGFCPVEYWVPQGDEDENTYWDEGSWGFVKGCVWGDDSSMKVEWLIIDPENVAGKGVIRREARFGYCELADGIPLKQAIKIDDFRPLSRTPGEFYEPGSIHDSCYFRVATLQGFNMAHDEKITTYRYRAKGGHETVWPEPESKPEEKK
jgi:hypothetical protein